MADSNYRMNKRIKGIYSNLPLSERNIFKKHFVEADFSSKSKERMTMMYDVSPNGKRSGSTKKNEKQD